MLRLLPACALLTGALALMPDADAQTRASAPTHSVVLFFDEADAVRVEITPRTRDARAPWGRSLEGIALLTDGGHVVRIVAITTADNATARADAAFPAGETVLAVFVQGDRATLGWKIGDDPTGRKTEWTFLDPRGTEIAPPAPEGVLCPGIVDPWTGECYEEIRDPWGLRGDAEAGRIDLAI